MALYPTTRRTHHKSPHLDRLNVLCHGGTHPIPCRMAFIGTAPHPKYRSMSIYACPFGRGTPHACQMRTGYIVGYDGRPFELWRGAHNGNGRR